MSLKQVLRLVWNNSLRSGTVKFDEIVGHDDIKTIFTRALLSKRPIHVLLVDSPGSAKTMFLTEILHSIKESYFIVGSNTSKAGLVNQLFERRPKFLLIDELDKMNKVDQTSLLHLMETGIISETKINKTREMELPSWVFATANSCDKIIEPLLSRFLVLEVPEYTFKEFTEIAINRLAEEKVDRHMAAVIAEKVWDELDSRDIRDVIKVSRLVTNPEDISRIICVMNRYSRKQQ